MSLAIDCSDPELHCLIAQLARHQDQGIIHQGGPFEILPVLAYNVSKSQGQGWRESSYAVELKREPRAPNKPGGEEELTVTENISQHTLTDLRKSFPSLDYLMGLGNSEKNVNLGLRKIFAGIFIL